MIGEVTFIILALIGAVVVLYFGIQVLVGLVTLIRWK